MTHGQTGTLRWSPDHLGRFVDQVRDDRYFAIWMLIATTGIQIDTLLDLRRGDVDLQAPLLPPRATTATRAGATPLAVTKTYALDPDTHDALREHVITWDREHTGHDLRTKRLFAWEDGEPLHPKSVEVLFRRHCRKADLPVVPLQAVRQAYVIAAIETGIPTTVISERLGHAVSPMNIGRIPRCDTPPSSMPAKTEAPRPRSRKTDRRQSCHLRSC
jgi:integrase